MGRGRIYDHIAFYDLIAEAIPIDGCDALSAKHGPVRLIRDGTEITMTKAG